jgi:hypothetical protein
MSKLPPPPIVPARSSVFLGGRAVSLAELHSRYPVLQPFVAETSFEDGESVFPTQEEAFRYVFRHAEGDMLHSVQALNSEIACFNSEFPDGSASRIAAFHALGSVIGHPDYLRLRLAPVDPERLNMLARLDWEGKEEE